MSRFDNVVWQVDLETLEHHISAWAQVLLRNPPPALWVNLQGELGAGKTTFMQMLLKGIGYTGRVKSPTYPLVESYALPFADLHHMDWYRLKNLEELLALGVRDWVGSSWLFVEWAERFSNFSSGADLAIVIRGVGVRRQIEFIPKTLLGWQICPK